MPSAKRDAELLRRCDCRSAACGDESVFSSYDEDDSGVIEEPEYGESGDDMGDGGFWDV